MVRGYNTAIGWAYHQNGELEAKAPPAGRRVWMSLQVAMTAGCKGG